METTNEDKLDINYSPGFYLVLLIGYQLVLLGNSCRTTQLHYSWWSGPQKKIDLNIFFQGVNTKQK